MRISDWSSDVCSSDLAAGAGSLRAGHGELLAQRFFCTCRKTRGLRSPPSVSAGSVVRHATLMLMLKLPRSEEHTSELQSLMRISYAVFCLKKKNTTLAETMVL